MNRIVFAIAIALLLLPGCARLVRSHEAARAQTELIGMSKKDLYLCAGVPARQATVEGLEFLTYSSGGDNVSVGVAGATLPSVGVGVATTQHRYCEVTFVLDQGIVKKVEYQGRTGGLISQGEQCAYVIENCLKK
jgi:hypothetical protein